MKNTIKLIATITLLTISADASCDVPKMNGKNEASYAKSISKSEAQCLLDNEGELEALIKNEYTVMQTVHLKKLRQELEFKILGF